MLTVHDFWVNCWLGGNDADKDCDDSGNDDVGEYDGVGLRSLIMHNHQRGIGGDDGQREWEWCWDVKMVTVTKAGI